MNRKGEPMNSQRGAACAACMRVGAADLPGTGAPAPGPESRRGPYGAERVGRAVRRGVRPAPCVRTPAACWCSERGAAAERSSRRSAPLNGADVEEADVHLSVSMQLQYTGCMKTHLLSPLSSLSLPPSISPPPPSLPLSPSLPPPVTHQPEYCVNGCGRIDQKIPIL